MTECTLRRFVDHTEQGVVGPKAEVPSSISGKIALWDTKLGFFTVGEKDVNGWSNSYRKLLIQNAVSWTF